MPLSLEMWIQTLDSSKRTECEHSAKAFPNNPSLQIGLPVLTSQGSD